MVALKGFTLASQSVSGSGQSTSKAIQVPSEMGGLAMVQVKIASGASDTLKAKLQGRASSSLGWVDLKKHDHSTEASLAQASGAATEGIFVTELMPEMRVDFSGTITQAHQVDVVLVAPTESVRANS